MLQMIATSTTGLESVVFNELKRLGFSPRNSETEVGRTFFEGDFFELVKANLWLRSAGKILVKLAEFEIKDDFDVLFDAVREIEWENWALRDASFVVEGRSVRSTITSVPALQRTVKKAIVSRLSKIWKTTTLPETGARYEVEISLYKDRATITLNTTGRGLHRRGYRLMNVTAPLRETLAAALVQLSVWKPGRAFVDPFCGSGTIPIEAALIGRNIAPGMKREFDAEKWSCIPNRIWSEARKEARDLILPPLKEKICGYDIDEKCVSLSRKHAELAGVAQDVVFAKRDFNDLQDDREYGCVVCNPPYGERLGEVAELRPLYESIPAVLSRLPTWSHFIFTNWLDFSELIGQEATRRRKLYNGRVECAYYQFLGPPPPKSFWQKIDADISNSVNSGVESSSELDSELRQDVSVEEENLRPKLEIESTELIPVFAGLDSYAEYQSVEFGRCLRNRVRHLRRYPSRGITCYRLYDRDFPEVPLAIDVFEGKWLHIAEYERPDGRSVGQHRLWLDKMVAVAADITGIPRENVFVKRRTRQRGNVQYEKLNESGKVIRVHEGGLTFLCNMTDYLDVGLFLDHRQTHDMVRREARDKRFLNLFCYTGVFTCYAADGGAQSTVSVDLSSTYLEWCEANFRENGFMNHDNRRNVSDPDNLFVKSDVLSFLRMIPHASERDSEVVKQIEDSAATIGDVKRRAHYTRSSSEKKNIRRPLRNKDKTIKVNVTQESPFGISRSDFDLCVCDPPTFSNSKSTDADWDVQRRHVELLRILATRMKPGGIVYFSNNFKKFKLDAQSLADLYDFREISNRTVPDDFRNKRIHRCWRMIAK